MKKICYCIGGSGARIAEVGAHLCAMNLAGNDDITIIIADKDAECGGTKQATEVIESVSALSSVDGDDSLGLRRSTTFQGNGKEFCKADIRIGAWDFTKALEQITPDGYDGNISLKGALGNGRSGDTILFNALYSTSEQNKGTKEGFYGHPSIGASIFKYMISNGGWGQGGNAYAEDDIAYPVKHAFAQDPNEQVKVFIIGSIFGGTGASLFSNLAHHIRSSVDIGVRDNLFISGVLLMPYFKFPNTNESVVQHGAFFENARTALAQYASDPKLLNTNGKGSFDSLYVCGQYPLNITAGYCHGGPEQKNHFDMVDLVSAKALAEFFAKDVEEIKTNAGAVYEYRLSNIDLEVADLNNLAGMRTDLTAMLSFCAFVITRVYGILKTNPNQPANNNMIMTLYENSVLKRRLGFPTSIPTDEYTEEIEPALLMQAEKIFNYCKSFIRLLYDLSKNGHDWSETGAESRAPYYNLFNSDYLSSLYHICRLLEQENIAEAANRINEILKRNDFISGQNAGLKPNDVEKVLEDLFGGKANLYNNNSVAPEERLGDYIHEAFKICNGR